MAAFGCPGLYGYLVLVLHLRTVLSDVYHGTWTNPVQCDCPNPVYVIGETLELNWTTPWDNYSIALWQSYPPGAATLGPVIYETVHNTSGLYNWSVSAEGFNLSVRNVFFLWLFSLNVPQGSHDPNFPGLSTHYFNISEPVAASSTLSSSTVSSTMASSTSVAPSSNTTAAAPTHQPAGLSAGASAGIGVGTVIAFISMLALGVLWYRRRRGKQSAELPARAEAGGPLEMPGDTEQRPGEMEQKWSMPPIYQEPVEAHGCMVPVELAAGQPRAAWSATGSDSGP